MTAPDWSLKYESFAFILYGLPIIAYCSGSYMSGANERARVIAIAKTENLVMYSATFSAASVYRSTQDSFGFT